MMRIISETIDQHKFKEICDKGSWIPLNWSQNVMHIYLKLSDNSSKFMHFNIFQIQIMVGGALVNYTSIVNKIIIVKQEI